MGNIDGRQGIKLGYGGVEAINAFNPERQVAIRKGMAVGQSEAGGEAMTDEVSQQAIEAASRALAAVVKQEQPEAFKAATVTQHRGIRRVKPVSVDLELLKSVADRFEIQVKGGKGHGYDQALLELLSRLEQGAMRLEDSNPTAERVVSVSQTVADQAKTLAWLTRRVEGLEAELVQVNREKEDAILRNSAEQPTSANAQAAEQLQQEVKQVRTENQRLNAELQQTQSRLESIQGFLNEGVIPSSQEKETANTTTPRSQANSDESQTALPSPPKPADVLPSQADLDPDALRALHKILDFNNHTATAHPEKWAISIPVMKDLLKQVGKATQPKIEAVLKAKREEIELHHRLHGLGKRHNRVHNQRSISEVIKL